MPLVSVIIPTYNRAYIVGYAIASATTQTYKNVEVIVVDDGSTDKTAEVVAQFGNKVKYLYKANGGVSSARNVGINSCGGELIAFLDSDDEWLPDKLDKQVNYLSDNPDFGMVLCDCCLIDSNRQNMGRVTRRIDLPKDGYILNDVLLKPYLIPSSVLIRKEALNDVGYFDEALRTAEDMDLFLRISRKYKIGLINEPLFNYTRGNDGLSDQGDHDLIVFVIERFINSLLSNINGTIVKKALFHAYSEAAKGKYWVRKGYAGTIYMWKACKCITSLSDLLIQGKTVSCCLKYLVKDYLLS
jgi:glycosyltransferase involved in cell wall biosynthesis